jgi:hypothetical protein
LKLPRQQPQPSTPSEPSKSADWFVEMSKKIEDQKQSDPVEDVPTVTTLQQPGQPVTAYVGEIQAGVKAKEDTVKMMEEFGGTRGFTRGVPRGLMGRSS